ncbi:MAG: hypothetical protein EON60_03970 [Alphaproteobacteria bacterium]|nr:MAG: hypothetical protein EON60_03970 [Alphaproteobacteria bacterium]
MPMLAAILSGLCFTLLGILIKRNTSEGVSPFILPSWLSLLFPVWCVSFLVMHSTGTLTFNLAPSALVWPLLWATCTVTTTTLLVWLLQSLSLTEVAGYKKALLTVLASGADVFIFQTAFPIATIAAIALILGGSFGIGQARHKLPTPMQAAAIVGWCLILTLQVSAYKQGQLFQPAVMSHTIIAQGMSTFLYSLLWLLPAVNRNPLPRIAVAGPILLVAFTGVILEGFAYAGLPLAVIIIITMSGAALFILHDLWNGDLPRTKRSYASLAAIAIGFLLLILPK